MTSDDRYVESQREKAFGFGYTAGKNKAFWEIQQRLADPHPSGCGCDPCQVIAAVQRIPPEVVPIEVTSDRERMIGKARRLLEMPLVVFDTETTGLEEDDQIVEIAAVAVDGTELLNTLVRPRKRISAEATGVHGISDELVASAPRIEDLVVELYDVFEASHTAAYHYAFDKRLLLQSTGGLFDPWVEPGTSHCIMEMYAAYHGVWDPAKKEYRFQSLVQAVQQCGLKVEGQPHRAMGDAKAAAALLRYMAYGWA